MKIKTSTRIHIETHETIVIRRASRFPAVWCATCDAEVRRLSPEQVAQITGMTLQHVLQKVGDNSIHSAEPGNADANICSRSLELTSLA